MITIARIQLKRMLKDKLALLAILLAPCLIILLVYFMTQSSQGVPTLDIAYVDNGEQAMNSFVESLKSSPRYVIDEVTQEDMKSASIYDVYDATVSYDGQFHIASSNEAVLGELKPLAAKFVSEPSVASFRAWMSTQVAIDVTQDGNAVNPLIGFIINYMMFSMVYIINEVILLRQQGIIKRLYSFSYHGFEIMMGVFLSMMALLLLQLLAINIVMKLCFDIYLFANLWAALPLGIAYSAVIIGLGLMIARYLKKSEFAALVVNVIVMPLGMVSGTFMPPSMVPKFLMNFRFLSPQYWLFQGFSTDVTQVITSCVILLLMGLLASLMSGLNFKKMIAQIA